MPKQAHSHAPAKTKITGFSLPSVGSGLGRILTLGRGVSVYYDQQPPNVWREHTHDQVQVLVAIDPVDAVVSWNLRGEQRSHGLSGQFIWILPEHTPHSLAWHGHGGMVKLYVERAFVRAICGRDLSCAVVTDFSTLSRLDPLVWRLAGELRGFCRRQQPAVAPLVEAVGTLLASQVLRFCMRCNDASASRIPAQKLREIMDHIDSHLHESVTRTDLARLAHLSVRSFGRQFKGQTGLTPRDYIRRRRTVRALELLSEGRMKAAAIASEVGFCDQSYMRRQILRFRAEELAASTMRGR